MKAKRPVSAKTHNSLQELFRNKQFQDEVEKIRTQIIQYSIINKLIPQFDSSNLYTDLFENGSYARKVFLFVISDFITKEQAKHFKWYAQLVYKLMKWSGFVGGLEFPVFSRYILEDELYIPEKFYEVRIEEPGDIDTDDSELGMLRTRIIKENFPLAIRFPPHITPEELKKFITLNAKKLNEIRKKYDKRIIVKKRKDSVSPEILDYIIENPRKSNNVQLIFEIQEKFSVKLTKKKIEYLKSVERSKRNEKIF